MHNNVERDLADRNAAHLVAMLDDIASAFEWTDGYGCAQPGIIDWMETWASRLESLPEFQTSVGVAMFNHSELLAERAFVTDIDMISNDPAAYTLSTCLWLCLRQTQQQNRAVKRLNNLYHLLSLDGDATIRSAMAKAMNTGDGTTERSEAKAERKEHGLSARLAVFRRIMELLVFPKATANPWLVGRSDYVQRFGQYVKGCGIYCPNDGLGIPNFYSTPKITEDGPIADMRMRHTVKRRLHFFSDSTLNRCVRDLCGIQWIHVKTMWTRSLGKLRFIRPNIFRVMSDIERVSPT